ncbi:hypothetical protein I2I05_13485 [Hymenobacter sp. BT683]|uniref:Uncharacterized protein n=1 Tax=Hymenobacter jeongseonensis TaxID=2791027 RepID=A0ABS0IJ57_9BACT|nr:hypothetical protein [Hymenobacter jeongseonensis]MBF9238412.1 hypothetical protein [Hymenobacter jeongseonensis]
MKISQFFRTLLSKPTSDHTSDSSFGLIHSLKVDELLRNRQWMAFEATVAALPTDELTRLLDGLCATPNYTRELYHYQEAGESELQHLMAGIHDTFLAWEARSKVVAQELTEKQINGFAHYLAQAIIHLDRSFKNHHYQVEAHARLIRVHMGLNEPQDAQQAFFACRELVEDHLLGYMNYFKLAAPRWFGDAAVLAEFADEAPTTTLRQLLQANFLVERYSDFDLDNLLPAKDQLQAAYSRRINQLLPELKPLSADSLLAIYYNNYAACLHHALGNVSERNSFLLHVGPSITFYPWAYFGLDTPAAVRKLSRLQ